MDHRGIVVGTSEGPRIIAGASEGPGISVGASEGPGIIVGASEGPGITPGHHLRLTAVGTSFATIPQHLCSVVTCHDCSPASPLCFIQTCNCKTPDATKLEAP
jgi:hypothetical protein